jgi:bifunctional non-homologous end joining protein LigD
MSLARYRSKRDFRKTREPAPKKRRPAAGTARPVFVGNEAMTIDPAFEATHVDRVYWPGKRYTKGDLLQYYESVARYLLPHLKDRPVVLKRFPQGIGKPSFFQKNVQGRLPRFVKRAVIPAKSVAKDVHYVVCNNLETLLYLGNMGTIELHPWGSRIARRGFPDFMVFDLDPGTRTTFDMVVDAAHRTKSLLDELGLPSYPKTSGKRGIHIYVPLGARYSYDHVRKFARGVADKLMMQHPRLLTSKRGEERRVGRVFVDYLRNSIGQTTIAPYSPRASELATVSTPLQWKELRRGLHPEEFTIRTIGSRLARVGDIFAGVLGRPANLQRLPAKLRT